MAKGKRAAAAAAAVSTVHDEPAADCSVMATLHD